MATDEGGEGALATRRYWLALLAIGLAVGAVAVAFHASLGHALALRETLTSWAQEQGRGGALVLVATCATAVGFAVWITERFAPPAAGSGIQHVEGVLAGRLPVWPLAVVWVKFVGGLVGIGGGLFLGREGPTVQMGASIAHALGARFGFDERARRTLLGIGAGAGLAGAFNAPFAGVLFVAEELRMRFVPAVVLGTLLAATATDACVRVVLGPVAELSVPVLPPIALGTLAPALAVGLAAGLLGVLFSATLLRALDAADALRRRVPGAVLGLVLGATLGGVAWFAPSFPGSGVLYDARILDGSTPLGTVAWLLPASFALTIASYAVGAPGGIFAPLLVIGASLGLAVHGVWDAIGLATPAHLQTFAAAGMAGLFAATVRAPFTGAVLLVEMTGRYAFAFPLVVASLAGYAVAEALGSRPIYASLLDRATGRRVVR
jgi:CIC family chloride channel protein